MAALPVLRQPLKALSILGMLLESEKRSRALAVIDIMHAVRHISKGGRPYQRCYRSPLHISSSRLSPVRIGCGSGTTVSNPEYYMDGRFC